MALETDASRSENYRNPKRPVAIWRSEDLLGSGSVGSLTVILRTVGCRWNKCTMCGYASEGVPATTDDLIVQFAQAMERLSQEDRIVKIYTSGSFLDPREVPEAARDRILDMLQERGIERLVIESRPEHITPEHVNICLSKVDTEFAIGLETSSDLIRENIICKGFSFNDFRDSSEIIHKQEGKVKAYLLLKPPLLSERRALLDAVSSARAARPYADTLSLNLCNIQRGTYVERLWERGGYRPPWLWSALEVLRNAEGPIICDPVGAGTKRGPHNCGKCDAYIAEAIRRHALTQDLSAFDGLDCRCRTTWQKVMEVEEHSFGAVLD